MSAAAFALTVFIVLFLATIGLVGGLMIVSGLRAEDEKETEE